MNSNIQYYMKVLSWEVKVTDKDYKQLWFTKIKNMDQFVWLHDHVFSTHKDVTHALVFVKDDSAWQEADKYEILIWGPFD